MTTPVHSPGPLEIGNHQDVNHHVIYDTATGKWIAVIQHNGELMPARQEANARLWAAAPDLFTALASLQHYSNDGGCWCNTRYYGLEDHSTACQAARRILAKLERR